MVAYQKLYQTGELSSRVLQARDLLKSCSVCPLHCSVNRLMGESGKCRTTHQVVISSYGPHFGEEAPLVGKYGSGTIFFTNCNLKCVFCQNYQISQRGEGQAVTREQLAEIMLALQAKGCHNINLVSPTHVLPQILESLEMAAGLGLSLPLVYNSGGYDSVETLKILDGIIDIYMPDMKYSDEKIATEVSGVNDYPSFNQAAVKEMHRQVSNLEMDDQGIARRGLLVRHLVLPHGLAGSLRIMEFLAKEISAYTYLNIMAQYRPCHRAMENPRLTRPLLKEEFLEVIDMARQAGLHQRDDHHPIAAPLF